MITAVVGSGGKTTLIHKLAKQYHSEGKKTLVVTTTHMLMEQDTLISDDADEIIDRLNENGYVMTGTLDLESSTPSARKITALSCETFYKICQYADEVLIEADGSRGMPLKYPNENEPVIPTNVDKIIIVSNLTALDCRAAEVVHRLDLAKKSIQIDDDAIITPSHIQNLLIKGYIEPMREKYPDKEIALHINHNGSLYERAVASLISENMDANLLVPGWFAPKPCLFICGGGHVAKELADIASKLDFRIHIIDSRPDFVSKERFPYAERIICDDFENLGSYLIEDAFYVVVTPGHKDDYLCVKTICGSKYRYIGMIGSHKKVAKTFDNLRNDGISDAVIDEIHAPIGLPIGANTPAEIAISILAEIIQTKSRYPFSCASTELLETDKSGMLCIIVDKTGSSPRGVGSMMLVTPDGQIDTIGGGAIENAAIEDARQSSHAFIREYQLNENDVVRLGMICGGTNKVLFVPV